MVLTGRESLIRLIGKRRRFLPNRHSILSDPIPIQSLPPQQSTPPDPQNDVVHCPVCGCALPSDNRHINSHLDSCLSQPKQSGTKRKLTQRTLLQLNFTRPVNLTNATSHVRDDTCQEDSQFPEIENQIHNDSASLPSTSNNIGSHSDIESNDNDIQIGNDHDIDSNNDNDIDSNDNIDNNKDDKLSIFGVKLETFIVGRKYADQEEVCVGTIVSLLRDPENVKDPNAIKVVSADTECSKFLGYLPRELAQYLSPLIDEYGLEFQGHVTSLPKHSLDVVPIQITCHGTPVGESEYEDETFKGLWKNAQHVVESAITNPSSSVKYQLNFCLMLLEVLRNNIHLLTEDEKTYMESFTLLSNDSQRLFIRLYTRKGPWFRMSSISYLEIMDVQKAVRELAGNLR